MLQVFPTSKPQLRTTPATATANATAKVTATAKTTPSYAIIKSNTDTALLTNVDSCKLDRYCK